MTIPLEKINETLADYETDLKRMAEAGLLTDSTTATKEPPAPAPPEPPDETEPDKKKPPRWPLWLLLCISVIGAIVVGVIGFAGSYSAVRNLALDHSIGPTIATLLPIGVDAGIASFLCLDLALAMKRIPVPILRPAAYVLTAATVWFNAAPSWAEGDWTGTALHAVLPILFVIAVESGRHAVAQLAGIQDGTRMDGVRLARWLLAFPSTFALWRRMRLWEITSYAQALELERLRRACKRYIKQRYGTVRKCPVEVRSYWDDASDGSIELDREAMLTSLKEICDGSDADARALAKSSRRRPSRRPVDRSTTLGGKGKQTEAGERNDAEQRPLKKVDLAKVRRVAKSLGGADKLSVSIVKNAIGGGQTRYLVRLRSAVQAEEQAQTSTP